MRFGQTGLLGILQPSAEEGDGIITRLALGQLSLCVFLTMMYVAWIAHGTSDL
jgi:hypothetical protein